MWAICAGECSKIKRKTTQMRMLLSQFRVTKMVNFCVYTLSRHEISNVSLY